MDHPVKAAFCKLLFASNGGTFDERGLPKRGTRVRGKCDAPFDCVSCPLMQEWMQFLVPQGWVLGWECTKCIDDTKEADEATGTHRELPGYYSAGRDPHLSPEDEGFDPEKPALAGCTRCGWQSSLLQLVLRRR